jgi:hypothetical protein
MRKLIVTAATLGFGMSTIAFAETATVPAPSNGTNVERVESTPPTAIQNAPAEIQPNTTNSKLPLEGANSFTEAQAKQLVEDAGYTGISALTKDQRGVWRGTAMKAGKSASVAVDFKGNVVQIN